MQKITILVLVSLAFVLTACFRSAGSDTPTAQPVALSGDVSTDAPTQEILPTDTPTQEVAVQASPTETDVPPSSTPTVTATVPVSGQGGDSSGEAIPIGEGPTSTNTASPTVQIVIQPTDTPTATASSTATNTAPPTSTATATATATASATATVTLTNTPAGPTPTLTTVPLQFGIQNTSNGNPPIPQVGQGGQLGPTATTIGLQGEVAQVVTATPSVDPFSAPTVEQLPAQSVNQLTATAIVGGATQTQAAIETIQAGGDPNAVQQQQITPGAGGQTIIITATPLGQAAPDCEYLVQIGDNLGTIANTYNTTIDELAIRNSITNPDLIRAGYPIIIPGCGQSTATTSTITLTPTLPSVGAGGQTVAPTNNANGPFTYTVQAGDNIYRLSVTYGVTMREILAANTQITNMNVITEGQQITIPGPPTQTTTTTTALTPTPNIIIVTPTPLVQGAGGAPAPTIQVVQPTVAQPVVPQFTPTFTLAPGAQG